MKNNTLAIDAAPSAIPPNPKMAAIIAITKKITDQRNIVLLVIIIHGREFQLLHCCDRHCLSYIKHYQIFVPQASIILAAKTLR